MSDKVLLEAVIVMCAGGGRAKGCARVRGDGWRRKKGSPTRGQQWLRGLRRKKNLSVAVPSVIIGRIDRPGRGAGWTYLGVAGSDDQHAPPSNTLHTLLHALAMIALLFKSPSPPYYAPVSPKPTPCFIQLAALPARHQLTDANRNDRLSCKSP